MPLFVAARFCSLLLRVGARIAVASLALALAAGAACGGEAPRETAPLATATQVAPTPQPTATATPPPRPRPEANPFPPELQAEAERLLQRIAEVRNSPPKRGVDMFVLTREQARAHYSRPSGSPPAQETPARLDLKQEVYELLGLVPSRAQTGRDLEQQQVDNLIALITGFYEPEWNALYLLETLNGGLYGGLARSTIVHELTHALQYQYADLDAEEKRRAGNWDATTALLDVIEGDAVNTEIQVLGYSTRSTYRQPVCFVIPPPQRQGTPFVVERELDTWYEDGLCFVQVASKQLSNGVAGIFERLPETTEQILHPEKYLADEGPAPVHPAPLTSALGSGWQEVGRNTFGEFGLQNVLLTGLVSERAAVQAAAAGWGGDAFVLYANGAARLFHGETIWDSPEDAQEFFAVL
ncbi:MAG TPA: hypothetical protein VNN21_07665, partial [Dehalococcoidia bacterium]|nr:hypothetical protein [Dehalococcoidia bacterium]